MANDEIGQQPIVPRRPESAALGSTDRSAGERLCLGSGEHATDTDVVELALFVNGIHTAHAAGYVCVACGIDTDVLMKLAETLCEDEAVGRSNQDDS